MDTSSVPENEKIEKAKAHNLLSQLHCCLFPGFLAFGNGVLIPLSRLLANIQLW